MVTALQWMWWGVGNEHTAVKCWRNQSGFCRTAATPSHENKTCPKMSQKWTEIWLVMWHVSLQKEELHLPLKNTRINNNHLLSGHRQVRYFSHLPLNFPEAVKSKVSVLIHESALAEKTKALLLNQGIRDMWPLILLKGISVQHTWISKRTVSISLVWSHFQY